MCVCVHAYLTYVRSVGVAPVSHVDLTASELARTVGVSEEDLTRHVLKQHLKEIADCIPGKWCEFMGQSVGARDF